mmetsp:Transcript_137617/g.252439  ORF Transcript_137617/g.252439 Transcript_137617/m.252439 type:complete len:81 (+) Transcript_137617:1265-1507(+)
MTSLGSFLIMSSSGHDGWAYQFYKTWHLRRFCWGVSRSRPKKLSRKQRKPQLPFAKIASPSLIRFLRERQGFEALQMHKF